MNREMVDEENVECFNLFPVTKAICDTAGHTRIHAHIFTHTHKHVCLLSLWRNEEFGRQNQINALWNVANSKNVKIMHKMYSVVMIIF